MTLPYTLTFADGEAYVTGPPATALGATFTVEAVARVDVFGVCNRPVLHKYAAGAGAFALYLTPDARLYFVVYDDHGGASSAWTPAGAVTGGWQHLAGTFDRAALAIRVYIDGRDATAGYVITGYAVNVSAAPVRLGGTLAGLAAGFAGQLAWARISATTRYAGAYVAPYGHAPTWDAATLELWDLSEGGGATISGDPITGATWGLWGGADAATRAALLDHVFGGPTYTRPATLHLGLLTANPATAADEVTASGYARVAIANNATNFPAASAGVKTAAAAGAFATAGADWGLPRAWGLWDAAAGGRLAQWGPVTELRPVWAGAQARFMAGALAIGSV